MSETTNLSKVFDGILNHYTTVQPAILTQIQRKCMSIEAFEADVKKHLNAYKLSSEDSQKVLASLKTFLFGYYKLTPLLDDPDISDIRCHNAKNIRVKKFGKRYATTIQFQNNQEYMNFIQTVAIKNQRDLSMINAQQIFSDTESHPDFILRFDISTKFINSTKTHTMHIRKIPKNKVTFDDLLVAKPHPMMDEDVKNFILNQIKGNKSMIVGGPNAAGKTTFTNAALEEYPHNLSGQIIQETEELFSYTHPDLFYKKVIEPNGEGKIEYTIRDEIKHSLTSDNNLIVIGEVKDEAALDVINAAYTGSTCWLSTHGVSSQDCAEKLADYAVSAANIDLNQILKRLSFMNIVVFIEKYRVKEISKIVGVDYEKQSLKYELIYSYEKGIKNFDKYYVDSVEDNVETLDFGNMNNFDVA